MHKENNKPNTLNGGFLSDNFACSIYSGCNDVLLFVRPSTSSIALTKLKAVKLASDHHVWTIAINAIDSLHNANRVKPRVVCLESGYFPRGCCHYEQTSSPYKNHKHTNSIISIYQKMYRNQPPTTSIMANAEYWKKKIRSSWVLSRVGEHWCWLKYVHSTILLFLLRLTCF